MAQNSTSHGGQQTRKSHNISYLAKPPSLAPLLLNTNENSTASNEMIRNRTGFSPYHNYIQVLTIFTTVGILIALAIPQLIKRLHLGGTTAFWFLAGAFTFAYSLVGLSVYAKDRNDRQLQKAAREGHIDGLKAVLLKGADVNRKDDKGLTPLMYAAWNGYTEVVRVLVANGANVNAEDTEGNTVLMHAERNFHTDTVDYLIEAGAEKSLLPID